MDQTTLPGLDAPPADKHWRSPKVRRPRAEIEPHVKHVTAILDAAGIANYPGGSYRRNTPTVGDLDILVVVDSTTEIPEIPGFEVHKGAGLAQQGDLTVNGITIHLDLWTVKSHELGGYLWYVTGPKDLNVAMRLAALKKGLHLKQQGLITKCPLEGKRSGPQGGLHKCSSKCDVKQVDNGTEEDIARILGWPMMTPEERQAWNGTPVVGKDFEITVTNHGTKPHVLRRTNGKLTCDCTGFGYRKWCNLTKDPASFGVKI